LEKLIDCTGAPDIDGGEDSGASTDWQSIYMLSSPNETALFAVLTKLPIVALFAVLTKLPIVVIGLAPTPEPVDD
jgi:hypothetical protein